MEQIICNFNKFPDYVDAAGAGTTLRANCSNPKDWVSSVSWVLTCFFIRTFIHVKHLFSAKNFARQ